KKAIRIHDSWLFLAVFQPLSADYGIRNRYLHEFNLLTDGLAMKPDLLYNSRQSSTQSPELLIRTIQITPEFSISAVFKKQQYAEFLENRIYRLHWWLELLTLLFIFIAAMDLFFEFFGICGLKEDGRGVVLAWSLLVVVSLLACLTVTEFSAFGATDVFRPFDLSVGIYAKLFGSSGGLFFTSFFMLNVISSFGLLVKRIRPRLPWKGSLINSLMILIALLLVAVALDGYHEFVRKALLFNPFDPIDFSLFRAGIVKIAQIFGMLWLDFAFVLFIGIVYAVVLGRLPRNVTGFLSLLGLQTIAFLILSLVLRPMLSFQPFLPLYFGVSTAAFFLPRLSRWFEKMNLVSRFLVAVVGLSLVSFLFHFTRFHYAGDSQRSFIEREAASQVIGQEEEIHRILLVSQQELDASVQRISVDPRIPDLAYRLWAGTELAQQ
ncbi:MAG TPA: hypothetical protein VI958_07090, partial [Acidobacteriota bacterium]